MKNVKVLTGVQPDPSMRTGDEANAPVQEVSILATVDKKTEQNPDGWQGYIVLTTDEEGNKFKGLLGAGKLLALQQETGIEVFTEVEDGGLELVNFNIGFEKGQPILED